MGLIFFVILINYDIIINDYYIISNYNILDLSFIVNMRLYFVQENGRSLDEREF
jgi:hypothetical protein